jgi:hypothetical protein
MKRIWTKPKIPARIKLGNLRVLTRIVRLRREERVGE